ncbi:MAG: ChuX/HutX family heme-like substrate-binding protein [Pseudomonadota bacterium]
MPAQSQLLLDFKSLRENDPTIRAVDAATRLGVPEGALVEARVATDEVTRLSPRGPDFADVIYDLKAVGPVMTLTRNDAVVHETKGPFGEIAIEGGMGQVTGDIDLRLFLRHWHAGYAIVEETKSGVRHSIQIFDAHGSSVLKIYSLAEADMRAWDALVARHLSETEVSFDPPQPAKQDRPDAEINVSELRTRWKELQHSHEFFMILRDVGAGRQQALRLAGEDLAQSLPAKAATSLLEGASAVKVPIMCFVGNPGCIQIFSGRVDRVVEMGPWLNVLDDKFNLHMRQDKVASAWLVRKPTTARGLITSIELFDADNTMVCQFFGSRPPGGTENPVWRELAEGLLSETVQ